MNNYIQPGENITLAAPYDVASGAGALVGAIFGVAQAAALETVDVVVVRRGVFELAKTSTEVWAVGDAVYWDDTAKECTAVAADNTLIGAAVAAAVNPSATGTVLLMPTMPSVADGFAQAAFVADASSGSAGEINALRDALVTAGLMAAS